MQNKLSPGETVVLVAGVLGLVGSFLPWFEFGPFSRTAWSTDAFFPVSWYVPMSAVVAALLVALPKFTSVSLPSQVLGFTLEQVRKVFAFMGALLAVGWIIAMENAGVGFWLSVAAAIGAAVGVAMLERDQSSA